MELVYLAGAPASGKSALMAELTRLCDRVPQKTPIPYEVLVRSGMVLGAELGFRRESFSGTDAMPMNIQPKAKAWMAHNYYHLVLGEGQRLGNPGFLESARDAGYNTTLVYLIATEDQLNERRNVRGSSQNCSWMKGAATQAANLAASQREAGQGVIELDTAIPLAELAGILCEQVPALARLRT